MRPAYNIRWSQDKSIPNKPWEDKPTQKRQPGRQIMPSKSNFAYLRVSERTILFVGDKIDIPVVVRKNIISRLTGEHGKISTSWKFSQYLGVVITRLTSPWLLISIDMSICSSGAIEILTFGRRLSSGFNRGPQHRSFNHWCTWDINTKAAGGLGYYVPNEIRIFEWCFPVWCLTRYVAGHGDDICCIPRVGVKRNPPSNLFRFYLNSFPVEMLILFYWEASSTRKIGLQSLLFIVNDVVFSRTFSTRFSCSDLEWNALSFIFLSAYQLT